jgi:hypothetical protein
MANYRVSMIETTYFYVQAESPEQVREMAEGYFLTGDDSLIVDDTDVSFEVDE